MHCGKLSSVILFLICRSQNPLTAFGCFYLDKIQQTKKCAPYFLFNLYLVELSPSEITRSLCQWPFFMWTLCFLA